MFNLTASRIPPGLVTALGRDESCELLFNYGHFNFIDAASVMRRARVFQSGIFHVEVRFRPTVRPSDRPPVRPSERRSDRLSGRPSVRPTV